MGSGCAVWARVRDTIVWCLSGMQRPQSDCCTHRGKLQRWMEIRLGRIVIVRATNGQGTVGGEVWGDDLFGEHMMSVTHKKNAEVTTCNEWEGALALTNRLQPLMSYVNEGLTIPL